MTLVNSKTYKTIPDEVICKFYDCPVKGCSWFGLSQHARNTHIGTVGKKDPAHREQELPPIEK